MLSAWPVGSGPVCQTILRPPSGGGQTQAAGPRIQIPALWHPSQENSDASFEEDNTPLSTAQMARKRRESRHSLCYRRGGSKLGDLHGLSEAKGPSSITEVATPFVRHSEFQPVQLLHAMAASLLLISKSWSSLVTAKISWMPGPTPHKVSFPPLDSIVR